MTPTLDLPNLIHELGRGARGARPLPRETARELFGAMLAAPGTPQALAELELGAILTAYRIKGETADELAGMLDACQQSITRLDAPPHAPPPVVIPSYNGARKLPNLTPLLALALAQRGIPALVHGDAADGWGRVASASVFAALGIGACRDAQEIAQALATRRIAFAPIEVLSPGLERLLATRARLGVRGPAHTLVKLIQPFATPALRLVNYTHPLYRAELARLFLDARLAGDAGVLLARGCEGEAVADPRRHVALEWLCGGASVGLIDAAAGDGSLPPLPASREAEPTARWIERALRGEVAVPAPLARQIEAIASISFNRIRTCAAPIAHRSVA